MVCPASPLTRRRWHVLSSRRSVLAFSNVKCSKKPALIRPSGKPERRPDASTGASRTLRGPLCKHLRNRYSPFDRFDCLLAVFRFHVSLEGRQDETDQVWDH